MARTESELFETLSDFLEWASRFDEGTYVFRGVPNDTYSIQASAYRRVPKMSKILRTKASQHLLKLIQL